jgi:hypothetical protein
MLKRLSQAGIVAAALALAPIGTAKAAVVCTSGSFSFCFDFTFTSSSASVTYQSGLGTLTAFGIGGYTGIGSTGVNSTAGSFSIGNANNCNAGGFNPVLCATSDNGINGGFPPVGTVNLVFSSTGQTTPTGTVHIQNAGNLTGCSLWINNAGQIISGLQDANCTTTTPEPATGALIATGLLGLGGGLIRRRRKNS